jgi:hypothetical protein
LVDCTAGGDGVSGGGGGGHVALRQTAGRALVPAGQSYVHSSVPLSDTRLTFQPLSISVLKIPVSWRAKM